MTGALLSFCVMAISIRELSGTLTIMEILALRAALGLAIIGAIAARAAGPAAHDQCAARLACICCATASISARNICGRWSLLLLPLATVFALEFTMPAWTILLAPFFLGERMTREPHRRGHPRPRRRAGDPAAGHRNASSRRR